MQKNKSSIPATVKHTGKGSMIEPSADERDSEPQSFTEVVTTMRTRSNTFHQKPGSITHKKYVKPVVKIPEHEEEKEEPKSAQTRDATPKVTKFASQKAAKVSG
jgi:hypothetical protein